MKRLHVIVLAGAVLMMAACTPPLSPSDKALLDQAIAASKSAQASADSAAASASRAGAAADRAEAAAQRAEDAAQKCERAFETSIKK